MQLPELAGYKYDEWLGEDPFGWTFLSAHRSGERRIVRVLKAQATNDKFLYRQLLPFFESKFANPGVARVHDVNFQSEGNPTVLATTFHGWRSGEGGEASWEIASLERLAPSLDHGEKLNLLGQLARTLGEAHRAGSLHSGLRPGNVLLASGTSGERMVKVTDFGLGFLAGTQFLELGEVLFHVSPEQLATGDYSGGKGFRWDVYAFGAIAFQLLTGHLPRLDRLHRQCLANPSALEGVAAIASGRLTDASEHFYRQLEQERGVEWPGNPGSAGEAVLRPVIETCLAHAAEDRYASMEEAAAAWSAALESAAASESATAEAAVADAAYADTSEYDAGTEWEITEASELAEAEEPPRGAREAPVRYDTGPAEPVSGGGASAEPPPLEEESESSAIPSTAEKVDPGAPVSTGAVADTELAPAAAPEEIAVAKPGRTPRWRSSARWRSGTWWRAAAVAAALAIVACPFLLVDNLKLRDQVKSAEEKRNREKAEHLESQKKLAEDARSYRRQLNQGKKNTSRLREELNEVESTRSNLLGEAKLARQVVRLAQAHGDRFFRLILDNRDTDVPAFRDARTAALPEARRHYERLIDVYGGAPDFIESAANAMYYLGEIYKEQGEFARAMAAFGEAERRYVALVEGVERPNPEYFLNLARAKRSLGQLGMKEGHYGNALAFFNESSRYWRQLRELAPDRAGESGVAIHENSLSASECELAIGNAEAALDGARSVGAQLLALQEKDPDDDRVLGSLAKSFSLSASVLENLDENAKAVELHQQAANTYAKAVELNAAVDEYQLGLGNSLARVGLLENDIEKLKGAAEVLAEAVALRPYETAYQRTLADVFGAMSANQRDGGQREKAIALERRAVSLLDPLVEGHPNAPSGLLFSYAQRLSHLAELQGDAGDFDGSRAPLRKAIDLLAGIAHAENARPAYRSALARAQGLAGFACIKSGDKAGAKQHFELAQSEWENYMAQRPDDDEAVRAAQWAEDQLRGL